MTAAQHTTVTAGLTLKDTAKALGISDVCLRTYLKSIGAIERTMYGWVAAPAAQQRGWLYTQTKQTGIRTEGGQTIRKHYTVVLVTGNGLAWLQATHNQDQRLSS